MTIEAENHLKFKSIDIIFLLLLYQLYWITVYYKFPNEIKYIIVGISFLYQFLSIERAIAILLMAIFIPFFSGYIGEGYFRLEKIYSFVFLIKYFSIPNKQKILVDKRLIFGFIIIFILIIFQFLFLIKYPDTSEVPFTIKNAISRVYDFFIILFIYLSLFKKIEYAYLTKYFITLIVIFGVSMSISLLQMYIDNPQELYLSTSTGIMWNNEYFGHKNAWGCFYALFCLVIFYFVVNKNIDYINTFRFCFWFLYFIGFILLACSLSRRAMFVFIFGTLYLLRKYMNIKALAILIILLTSLIIFQPDFLYQRYKSLLTADSISDIQESSAGKLRENAIQQLIHRISIVPKFFTEQWEYNYSEGFYGQLLFRTGIIGLLFYLTYIISLIFVKNKLYSDLYNMLIFYFIFAGYGYRHAFISDIYGNISYIHVLVMFFIFLNLISLISSKNELNT